MKRLTTLLTALALACPAWVSAAEFEGTLKMNITESRGQVMPITFKLKSGRMRTDMQTGEMSASMIMDQAKQEVIVLMPEQKMYMVQPIPSAPPGAADAEEPKIEKTDEHEKILGYDTTKYIVTTKDATTEAWITDELGTFMGLAPRGPMEPGGRGGRRGSGQEAWQKAFKGKAAFPLRSVTKTAGGKESVKMEVTAIQKESLSDSLFQPPSDYQKFDMGGMMRGMGMPGGPGGARPPQPE